ncbi:hypothetical protein LCGC14_0403590 [marine sediment metagenome]|uniref:Uncharacterized protein n=1 Tax=marine sediment metagenome TaxID=412755 RepID=A0A0F9VI39_9ZZZZ
MGMCPQDDMRAIAEQKPTLRISMGFGLIKVFFDAAWYIGFGGETQRLQVKFFKWSRVKMWREKRRS